MAEMFERPWIEKYRPEYLNDVVGNKEVIMQLKHIAEQGNVPNMILVVK
jgi:replication factor C subunit 2/4